MSEKYVLQCNVLAENRKGRGAPHHLQRAYIAIDWPQCEPLQRSLDCPHLIWVGTHTVLRVGHMAALMLDCYVHKWKLKGKMHAVVMSLM